MYALGHWQGLNQSLDPVHSRILTDHLTGKAPQVCNKTSIVDNAAPVSIMSPPAPVASTISHRVKESLVNNQCRAAESMDYDVVTPVPEDATFPPRKRAKHVLLQKEETANTVLTMSTEDRDVSGAGMTSSVCAMGDSGAFRGETSSSSAALHNTSFSTVHTPAAVSAQVSAVERQIHQLIEGAAQAELTIADLQGSVSTLETTVTVQCRENKRLQAENTRLLSQAQPAKPPRQWRSDLTGFAMQWRMWKIRPSA